MFQSIRLDDARHEKTDLKVFVVVIPKEGWVYVAWYDTDFSEFDSADHRLYSRKVGVMPKEG